MWFPLALLAHLCNAFAFAADKLLVTKRVPEPGVPAFWIGSASVAALLLLPFGFALPADAMAWGVTLLSGFLFIAALVFFYSALKRGEASRVVPVVGGSVPIFTVFFARIFLGERLSNTLLASVAVLAVGAVVISWEKCASRRARASDALVMLGAGALFAASFVALEATFAESGFIAGFAWSRLGGLAAAVLLLAHQPTRRAIFTRTRRARGSTVSLLFVSQGAGALGFFLISLAISLKGATIVNALQGIQYVFLFFLVLILSRWFPSLREARDRQSLAGKTVGMAIIIAGLSLLSFGFG